MRVGILGSGPMGGNLGTIFRARRARGGVRRAIERDMVEVRLTDPGRFVVAAAPAYLERRGTPQEPRDLLEYECICIRASSLAPYARPAQGTFGRIPRGVGPNAPLTARQE